MKKLEEGLYIRVQELLLLGTFASHCEQAQASFLESGRPQEERHQLPGHPNCPRHPSHSICRHVNKAILKYLTQPIMRAMRNANVCYFKPLFWSGLQSRISLSIHQSTCEICHQSCFKSKWKFGILKIWDFHAFLLIHVVVMTHIYSIHSSSNFQSKTGRQKVRW